MHSTSRYSKQCARQGGQSDDWRGSRNEGRLGGHGASCDAEDCSIKCSAQWFEFRGVRCRLLRWGCEGPFVAGEDLPAPQNASLGEEANAPQGVFSCGSFADGLGNPDGFDGFNGHESSEDPKGSSRAPIVLLHGFAQSADAWDEVARKVAQDLRTTAYAIDFVGHGQSDKPASSLAYSMDFTCDMLRAFLRFVQNENAGRAPIVVGYSMGGRIALASVCRALGLLAAPGEFCAELVAGESQSGEISFAVAPESPFSDAADFPLSALILESAGLGPSSAEERMVAVRANEQRACTLRQRGIDKFMDAWENLPLFATQRELPEEVRKRIRSGRMSNNAEALARTLEGTGAQHMPARDVCVAALAALAGKGVPVCYIAGQCDEKYSELAGALREPLGVFAGAGFSQAPASADVHAGPARSGRADLAYPGHAACIAPDAPATHVSPNTHVDVCIAPGVGHNVHLEAPDWFSRKLLSFMRRFVR